MFGLNATAQLQLLDQLIMHYYCCGRQRPNQLLLVNVYMYISQLLPTNIFSSSVPTLQQPTCTPMNVYFKLNNKT